MKVENIRSKIIKKYIMRNKRMDKYINTPINEKVTSELKSGDYVYITGNIYVERDAANKRMI